MSYTTLFFDLDDTLYPPSSGLWWAIRDRMGRYMAERIGLAEAEIPALRRYYFETYGTTLRGLQKHHCVDTDDYLAYVHDLPLEQYILPNPELRKMLASLKQRRFIFTNADALHANRVIQVLGVADCFEKIIDIRAIEFACKPEPLAYQRALALVGDPAPQECVLLDDSPANLKTARQLGFTTVIISPEAHPDPAASYCITDLVTLPQVFPALWNGSGATE
jgi:putative hydrolase of the HAD superfamily